VAKKNNKNLHMKRIYSFLLACMVTGIVNAQTKIELDEVSNHIGDSVTVCGLVASMRFFENSNRKPTFLNIGDKYPNQKITLVIWDDVRKNFKEAPETFLNKKICITGRIILYKEKPEIVIERPEQVSVE